MKYKKKMKWWYYALIVATALIIGGTIYLSITALKYSKTSPDNNDTDDPSKIQSVDVFLSASNTVDVAMFSGATSGDDDVKTNLIFDTEVGTLRGLDKYTGLFKCSKSNSGKLFRISCVIQVQYSVDSEQKNSTYSFAILKNASTALCQRSSLDIQQEKSDSITLSWNGQLLDNDIISITSEKINPDLTAGKPVFLKGCVLNITATDLYSNPP